MTKKEAGRALSALWVIPDPGAREEDQPGGPDLPLPTCRRRFNERSGAPFNNLSVPTDIVFLVVLWRLRYKLSLRDFAEMFLERGFVFSHETVRHWERWSRPCSPHNSGIKDPALSGRASPTRLTVTSPCVQGP